MEKHKNGTTATDNTDQNDKNSDALKNAVREGFKSHTKGESKFNSLTYKWVGYFGVTGFSVFLTWLIKDTKPLSGYFQKAVKSLTNQFTGIHAQDAKKREGLFNSILTIGTLFTGGSIVSVLPIKWLEDNKLRLVKKFDRQIYGDEAVENDPQIVAAHKLLEAQPKQGWGSVIGSRATAFLATLGTWFIIGRNDGKIAKTLGTSIDTLGVQFGRFADRIRSFNHPERIEKIHRAVKVNIADPKLSGELRDLTSHDSMFSRIFSYIGMDGLYTIVTSIGLFVSTRFLGPIFDKNKQPSGQPDTAGTIAAHDTAPARNPSELEQSPTHPYTRVSGAQLTSRLQQSNSHSSEAHSQNSVSNLKSTAQTPSTNILNINYNDRVASPEKTKNLEFMAPS
jgi:hypothetical protein